MQLYCHYLGREGNNLVLDLVKEFMNNDFKGKLKYQLCHQLLQAKAYTSSYKDLKMSLASS